MKQEDRKLLLADLCARLPYKVKGFWIPNHTEVISPKERELTPNDLHNCEIGKFKPYLRPMSSMTEDEKKEVEEITRDSFHVTDEGDIVSNDWRDGSVFTSHYDSMIIVDWLNAHHFDYRGLIEKGLALEAPEGMYK